MIRWLGARVSHVAERWVPDPFAIAIALTLLTVLICWSFTSQDPLALIERLS